ncbi:hypothetical protein Tco_0834662 [Tanacetum coccineum]
MEEFATNDKSNYYSGITSIMVNGKRAYELKGKFHDDLRDNDFSGTNREDAVEHIEYFLKIVDPINLPNVNYERLTLSVFPISLVGNARKCWITVTKAIRDSSSSTFEKWLSLKFANHMIMDPFPRKVLWDFWIKNNGKVGVTDKEFSVAENANNDDKQETTEIYKIETNLFDYETSLCIEFKEFNFLLKVDPELFTHDIERTKTYKDYENKLNDELEEPWSEDGVPYEICDHIFHFKNGKAKWPTCNSNEDGFSDGNLKEEAPKQKAIYEKSWGDASQGVMNFCAWLKKSFVNFHELDYELWVKLQDYCGKFAIRRFEMIKYSFSGDEEYDAVKENEYDDLTSTSKEAIRTYQEIFRRMDEGWMVTRAE